MAQTPGTDRPLTDSDHRRLLILAWILVVEDEWLDGDVIARDALALAESIREGVR